MALKPTIFKLNIALSDLERNYYDTLKLTVAQHPSETEQRLLARILAFVINAQANLSFTKGLSSVDEPDIWVRALDQHTELWIDVGEPTVDRIKKASRIADRVKIYSFNTKSEVWWQQNQAKFWRLNASIYRFNWQSINAFAELLERTMEFSITISDDSAYIAAAQGNFTLAWEPLQIV